MDRSNKAPSDRSRTAGRSGTAGADFLQLNIDEAPAGGLSDWLAGRLRLAISDGRLPVGSRLPATRVLAEELRVSRGVVTEAYQRMTEDGHVAGRGRSGTVVVGAPLTAPAAAPASGPPSSGPPASGPPASAPPAGTRAARTPFDAEPGADVFDALRAAPARIDLSPGLPDLGAFPRAAWLRAERSALGGLSSSGFGYGDPRGTPELRHAVADWLARMRGIRVDPDEVLIVAGTTQALALLARVLGKEGIHRIALEDPGSLGIRMHLREWEVETPPVPVDAEGVRVDELRATGAPAVRPTPAHQFPMGVVLGGERRRELMRWAGEGGLVIEDDYDAEHRYDRPPVPALRSMLAERVCYVGSVSKLLAPALRVGWVVPPPRYLDAMIDSKRYADLGNAVLPQLVLARLMDSGTMERHLRLLRRRHRTRRDAMIDAVAAHLPGAVVHGAAAGLHLTITFAPGRRGSPGSPGSTGSSRSTGATGSPDAGLTDSGLSDTDLAAAALRRGVKAHPLSWHRGPPGPPGLVLGYAASAPSEIGEGVAVLGEVLRQAG